MREKTGNQANCAAGIELRSSGGWVQILRA